MYFTYNVYRSNGESFVLTTDGDPTDLVEDAVDVVTVSAFDIRSIGGK